MNRGWKWFRLVAAVGLLMTSAACFFPRGVYRTPRVAVDTVRTRRCVGRQWTYFCRRPTGHIKYRKIVCRRYGRRYIKRRRWFVRDYRCRNHAYIGDRRHRRRHHDDGP